jgi:hypothetical protein
MEIRGYDRLAAKVIAVTLLGVSAPGLAQQQVADPDFPTRVQRPAFVKTHPRVGIDEAHKNFHTREGRYRPLAALLESDGYALSSVSSFEADPLQKLDILVIANALGERQGDVMGAAFTPVECDAVRDWVRDGGSLLLIADHLPFGDAAATLAQRFGIEMGRGWALDKGNSEGNPSILVFSSTNNLLGDHVIIRGRNSSERVRRIVAFTGQSLSVPVGATPLMKMSSTAREAMTPEEFEKIDKGEADGKRLEGRAQGLAMAFGKGRIAVFGEAAMFSAQVATFDGQSMKMGMNVPGNDDRQLALNVMHWLVRLIN